ncbi:class II glutamine amidotransferase, partial [Myxococcota bacterium]|nr:class II glutamine amidotransferase [Myxococcota bacterium]
MPNLLAMSFEGALTPAFDLHCLDAGRTPPDGWGIACYPDGEPAALVLKEAAPAEGSARSTLVSAWERLESSIFVVHIRQAMWGALTEANTQPFQRPWGRREWVFGHSGSLEHKLDLSGQRFEPVGSTDSEQVFCSILTRLAAREWRSIAEAPPELLLAWFHDLNEHGALTFAIADGHDLVVYADRRGQGSAYVWELLPPHGLVAFGNQELTVDLTRRGIRGKKGVIVASTPLATTLGEPATWKRLEPGHLMIVRQGQVRTMLGPEAMSKEPKTTLAAKTPPVPTPRASSGVSRPPVVLP